MTPDAPPPDSLVMLTVVGVTVVVVLAPPIAVWRALGRRATGGRGWSGPLGSLVAPAVLTYLLVVTAWVARYDGRCGGWLGETEPCRGFGQYVQETMYWAALSMGLPAALGLLLGIAVLSLHAVRRRRAGPDPR